MKTPATGVSTFWLPIADSTRAIAVRAAARWATIHDVIELSMAVEPSGRST